MKQGMQTLATPEDKGRAADLVVQHLAQKIQSGEFQDGQPLPAERHLMEEFGISRTVVREAVVALSNQGLVDARPRHRPVVRKPGYEAAFSAVESIVSHLLHQPDGVKNLFDTRTMLEISLVRQAATQANKQDLADLKHALDLNGAAVEDSELFYQTDVAFHQVLYCIPRNPVLPALHKAYSTWLAPHWSRMPPLPDRNRINHQAHQAVFDAILMRDPDAAEAALRSHLAQAWAQVQQTFGDI